MRPTSHTSFSRKLRELHVKRTKALNKAKAIKLAVRRQVLLLSNYRSNPPKYGGKPFVSNKTIQNMKRRSW